MNKRHLQNLNGHLGYTHNQNSPIMSVLFMCLFGMFHDDLALGCAALETKSNYVIITWLTKIFLIL